MLLTGVDAAFIQREGRVQTSVFHITLLQYNPYINFHQLGKFYRLYYIIDNQLQLQKILNLLLISFQILDLLLRVKADTMSPKH